MKTKEKKGKAIIGIAMAAIMLASVMVAMITHAAAFVRDARTVTDVGSAYTSNPSVVNGELINLQSGATILLEIEDIGPPITYGYAIAAGATSNFDTTGAPVGAYQSNIGTFVTLVSPVLDLKLQFGTAEVSSVTAGQRVDVVVDTNIPGAIGTVPPSPPAGGPNDLRLRIIGEDTGVETTAGIGAPAAGAPAGTMWSVTTGSGGLLLGDYTFTVETYTTGAARAAIDIESTVNDLTVRAAAIDVDASPTTQVVGNDIVITTTSNPDVCVIVTVSAPGAFDTTKGDYPTRALPGSTANIFNARMPSDGTLEAVISSTTTGAVTIRASVDNNCNWRIDPGETTIDTIDVTFITVPSLPQKLRATAGDGYVNLNWDAPSDDGGSPITGYNIYRGTAPGGERFVKAVGNVLIYTDNDVTNNQKYYYQVSAVNSLGEGEKSNEVDATPTPTPTTAPTTLTSTSTPTPTTTMPTLSPTPTPTLTPTTPTPTKAMPTPTPPPGPFFSFYLIIVLVFCLAIGLPLIFIIYRKGKPPSGGSNQQKPSEPDEDYAQKIDEYKEKMEEWEKEGYDVSELKEVLEEVKNERK
ncbi:MAG: fibronectin type III domain-containing protein [Methanophagales archaeon]|nr:fibronectin type III domain-containing protein [Methanophagales archaeon]